MKPIAFELVCGLAAGVTEGVLESFIPGSHELTKTVNKNLKTEAPLGIMICEATRSVVKKAIVLCFFI